MSRRSSQTSLATFEPLIATTKAASKTKVVPSQEPKARVSEPRALSHESTPATRSTAQRAEQSSSAKDQPIPSQPQREVARGANPKDVIPSSPSSKLVSVDKSEQKYAHCHHDRTGPNWTFSREKKGSLEEALEKHHRRIRDIAAEGPAPNVRVVLDRLLKRYQLWTESQLQASANPQSAWLSRQVNRSDFILGAHLHKKGSHDGIKGRMLCLCRLSGCTDLPGCEWCEPVCMWAWGNGHMTSTSDIFDAEHFVRPPPAVDEDNESRTTIRLREPLHGIFPDMVRLGETLAKRHTQVRH